MAEDRKPEHQTLSPASKNPAEGARDGDQSKPAPPVPDHLGPAGDPAEGK